MPVHKKLTKEITLYTLEEMLSDPELKKNLLKANEEDEEFLSLSLEYDVDDIVVDLESKGFCDVKIFYDLSHCQGSGAYFTFEGVNVLKLMKREKSLYQSAYPLKYLFKDWGRKLKQLFSYSDIKAIPNHWSNHNCHSKCVDIEFNDFDIDFDDEKFIRFKKDFISLYQDICCRIYHKLESALDYYTSEEFLIEDLKAREECSLFLESGGIAPEEYTNDSPLLNNITGFIYSKNSYVILDGSNRIFSYTDNREVVDGDFIDNSSLEDKGLSKAVIFSTIEEANDFIVDHLVTEYGVLSVDQAFRKE